MCAQSNWNHSGELLRKVLRCWVGIGMSNKGGRDMVEFEDGSGIDSGGLGQAGRSEGEGKEGIIGMTEVGQNREERRLERIADLRGRKSIHAVAQSQV